MYRTCPLNLARVAPILFMSGAQFILKEVPIPRRKSKVESIYERVLISPTLSTLIIITPKLANTSKLIFHNVCRLSDMLIALITL